MGLEQSGGGRAFVSKGEKGKGRVECSRSPGIATNDKVDFRSVQGQLACHTGWKSMANHTAL